MLYIEYLTMFYIECYFYPSLEGLHTCARFDLFLYLPMNRLFVTKWTEFSQFQSIRRVVTILFSNISGNTP